MKVMSLTVTRSKSTEIALFVAFVVFSWGSWIDVMGVVSQVPLMIPHLPEGWALGTAVALSIQATCMVPVVILVVYLLRPRWIHERIIIYIILSLGTTLIIALAFLWSKTMRIGKVHMSIPLLFLSAILGSVDNVSSVVFFPYAKQFPLIYLRAIFVGEGLTGLIPALLKIVQGGSIPICHFEDGNCNGTSLSPAMEINQSHATGEQFSEPRFSVRTYFLLLATSLAMSLIAFILIDNCNHFKLIRMDHQRKEAARKLDELEAKPMLTMLKSNEKQTGFQLDNTGFLTGGYSLLAQTFFGSLVLWGFLYSIFPYSLISYSYRTANLAIILVNLVRMLAYVAASYFPKHRLAVPVLNGICIAGSVYFTVCAVYSPCPPLVNTKIGSILIAGCFLACDFSMNLARVRIGEILMAKGGNWPLLFGTATNLGVLVGVLLSMLVDLHFRLLKSRSFCRPLDEQCTGFRRMFLPTS